MIYDISLFVLIFILSYYVVCVLCCNICYNSGSRKELFVKKRKKKVIFGGIMNYINSLQVFVIKRYKQVLCYLIDYNILLFFVIIKFYDFFDLRCV